MAPLQEYCLECGLRLPASEPVLAHAGRWRLLRGRDPLTLPLLVALVVTAAATVAAVVAARDDGGDEAVIVVTAPIPESVPVTTPLGAAPAEPTTTSESPSPRQRASPPRTGPIEWPQGRDGYTVVLASIPAAQGRDRAIGQANEALAADLEDVGVLRTDDYASLRGGYYVVFTGVYSTLAVAERATGGARRAGYETAYAAPVSR